MACWQVLTLSDLSPSQHVPQLLIKPKFERQTYTVYVTDLINIWCEELELDGILERASEQESPIEVSKQDTSQLAILLEHIHKSLTDADDGTSRRMVRQDQDGVVLHTSTNLPSPLGSLGWCFHLRKRTSVTLKNELILPLLVSSHIQHERVRGLVASIHEKDKAITKMLDQFESSNLDLASAFPSVGGSRPGRRLVKREQAARQVPALQPFEEDAWRRKTSQLDDGQLSTFSLFQEALSECTSKVPAQMESQNEDDNWWTSLRTKLGPIKKTTPAKAKVKAPELPKPPSERSDADTETEDEFETHENFKRREEATAQPKTRTPPTANDAEAPNSDGSDASTEDDEDDDDLDAPPRSQSQNHSQRAPSQKAAARTVTPEPSSQSPKRKGFRIGGARLKAKQTQPEPTAVLGNSEDVDANRNASSPPIEETASPRKGRRPFKIGGKKNVSEGDATETQAATRAQEQASTNQATIDTSRRRDASSSPARPAPIASNPPEEEHEETLEEKAERKRRELKRKNEELAKKQAQKKKKRF